MLFYKIEGMLEGNAFPEDGAIRRQAAKEFQGKQELFAKKLQGKCYLSISQIRDGRITLAAVSREEYNILARCQEFFQETDMRVSSLAAQEVTYSVLRSLLSCAERYGFLEDDQDVYEMFRLSELFHNSYNFDETLLPGRVSLEEQKRQTAKLLCQDAFDQELERIYQGPALLVGNGHPVHYLLVCGEGEARERQVELLLSALYQNGRIHSQRATWKAYDYDDRVDRDLLDSLYQASSGGAMVLSYNPESGAGSRRASAGLEVVMELCRAIRNYQSQTLTVLCLSPEGETAKKLFYENLGPLTFVELREDVVAGERARAYLESLAENAGLPADQGLWQGWKEDRGHRAGELRQLFDAWYARKLKT